MRRLGEQVREGYEGKPFDARGKKKARAVALGLWS